MDNVFVSNRGDGCRGRVTSSARIILRLHTGTGSGATCRDSCGSSFLFGLDARCYEFTTDLSGAGNP